MDNDRYARYGAATGIIAVILIMVGYGIATPDIPDVSAPADAWLSWVTDNQSQIHWGTSITAVGLFFFIWFLGSLRSALRAAEGGSGRLTSIAYGGGLVSAGFFVVSLTAIQAAAFRTDAPADVVRGLSDIATVCGAPAAGGFAALFGATAIVGYRHGAVPAPVAGFSALAAIAQPLALGVGVTDSGAFAGDGVLGLWVPVITFAIAILALSGALYRRPGGYAGSAAQ
jgi:hypothetical protein